MTLLLTLILSLAAAVQAAPAVRFCAVGDILLDRHIRQKIEENGIHYPLALAKELIAGHDLAFCNVESSISARGTRVRGLWRFRGDAAFVPMLREAGFNLACVANNHSLDYGREAFSDTMDALSAGGLTPIGGGQTQALAIAPTYVTTSAGLTIAFIGNEDVPLDGFTNLPGHSKLPGPAQASIESIEASVRKAKKVADVVVVSQHWGIEYTDQPRPYQVKWAHRLIDAGASLVLGHHPHVLQPLESYHGGTIIYSLGNFVFDQKFPRQTQTVIFECEFQKDGVHAPRLLPMRIDENFRPHPPTPEDARQILAWMDALSQPFATRWALSGTAAAYALAPAVLFQEPAAGGEVRVDSRGLEWTPLEEASLRWDAPVGKKLLFGVGQKDGESYRIYTLLMPSDGSLTKHRGHLAAFTLRHGHLLGPVLYPQAFDVWHISLTDLDEDGKQELCVGIYSQSPRGPAPRLILFERWRAELSPKASNQILDKKLDALFQELARVPVEQSWMPPF